MSPLVAADYVVFSESGRIAGPLQEDILLTIEELKETVYLDSLA